MLVFLLLLPLAGTTEVSEPEIIFKTIKSCPDVGYFFQRDKSQEFGPCYLCFCKAENKAVCSKRPSGRCDPQYYVHQKRKTRITRSLGFNDIFLRDAAREVFNTKLVQKDNECTPLRSSKSIGCPPEDWCTGCMVCDCDANGHWDCHIMSFCGNNEKPSRADKKFSKSKPQKTYKGKGNVSQHSEKRSNTKKSSPFKKIDKKAVTYGNTENFGKKSAPHPEKNLPETIISVQTKRQLKVKRKANDSKKSPTVVKKYISTMSPIQSPDLLKYKNDRKKLAQMLYKQFTSNQSKSPKKNQKASPKNMGNKIINEKNANKKNVKKTEQNMGDMFMSQKASNKKNIKQTKHMGEKIMHNKPSNKKSIKKTKQNMGDKIVNKKPANKKNIKKTKQNTRKSMFSKGSKDIPKIMPMNTKHSNKNNKMRDNSSTNKNTNKSGKMYKGKKFDSQGSKMRSKREVSSTATEATGDTTNIRIADGETTAHINQIANTTEITFTNNEFIQTTLNNFAYTIDNNVTSSITNKQSVYNITGYDTTENNMDVVTIIVNNFTEKAYNDKEDTNVKRLVTLIDSEFKTTTVSSYIVSNSDKKINVTNASQSEFNVAIENSTKTAFNPNQTVDLNLSIRNKVYGQDIKKIIISQKKFNLKKLIKNFKMNENYKLTSRNLTYTNNTRHMINGTLNNIQTVLDKFLQTANNTKRPSKKKHFTALKYIRKLFSRLFSNGRNKTAIDKLGVMNSICDNFGPCNFSAKKLKRINYKVKELISETQKALNSIKIIKGLLQLVHGEQKENGNATIKEANFKMHVRHLNAILKDNYMPEDQLTPTEVTQINYIKSNTKVFIKSIAKFGSILNDIIDIIKSETTKKKHSNKIMKNEQSLNKQEDSVNKLKSLLLRYNILQNTFLRKMYEALTKLETKIKLQHAKVPNNDTQPSKNETYNMAIAKYVQNINDNLKKLQDLASRVGSTQRRKRHTQRDDDAIEYLLTLMEYLLKRNNPQDTPPANDGIDLLIEAIKNAPEIKPTKKKVLQYVPVKINGAVSSAESNEANVVHRDNFIKNKGLSEDLKSKVKDKSYEDQSDNDETKEDKRQTKSSSTKKTDTTTKIIGIADLSDIITEYPSKVYMATYYTEKNTARPFFEKQVTNDESATGTVRGIKGKNSNKYVETDITDDDSNGLLQKARDFESVIQMDSTTVVNSIDNQNVNTKMRHFIPINSEYKSKNPEKETKTKLDLINEAYEKEIKEERAHTVKPPKSRAKGETGKRNKKPSSNNNISSITTEIIDDEKEKINEAELVYKKQMDLLNSLDYGTDRSVAEDSDSKDNSPVDRLNKEFPSYFV